MTYRYFELQKNVDPEREDSAQFKSAFTVHPVSEPALMYRLHKRYNQIELDWTMHKYSSYRYVYCTSY